MYDKVKFFRRRQFVLGPEYLNYNGWIKFKFNRQYKFTIHPDLQINHKRGHTNEAVLLGYVINPNINSLRESEILEDIVENTSSLSEVISKLETLTGRFVLFFRCKDSIWLFHDAVALRQVQYCNDKKGRTWCASQAETLAEHLGFEIDENFIAYRNIPIYMNSTNEFWIINDCTSYSQIKNLLPNHYLDLEKGKAIRYWPYPGCIPKLTVKESITKCAPILKNTINTAAEKFDLLMGISAGGDSRKTLAATKGVTDRIRYFTNTPIQKSMIKNDVRVPEKLLKKLHIEHHNVGLKDMDLEFKKLYTLSASWARENRGNIAYTLLKKFGPEITVLNSNISEIGQRLYWLPPSKISGKGLAVICGLNNSFAISEFQNWLDGALNACESAKMHILDLFFLEQRMGRWATAAFAEYDIVHETFNPYNNRYLHSLMMGVNERLRRNRRWDVLIKQIKFLWPEVLAEPINPPDKISDKIQQFIRRSLIHRFITPWFPVYEYLRYLKLKYRFNAKKY